MHHRAILAQVAVFEVELRLAAHDLAGGVEGALPVSGMHQIDHRLADQFVGGVAENTLAGRADKYEATLFIHRTDGVQQEIDVARQRRGISGCHGVMRVSGQCSKKEPSLTDQYT